MALTSDTFSKLPKVKYHSKSYILLYNSNLEVNSYKPQINTKYPIRKKTNWSYLVAY